MHDGYIPHAREMQSRHISIILPIIIIILIISIVSLDGIKQV